MKYFRMQDNERLGGYAKAYDNQEINDVGWIKTGKNIADAFKKFGRNDVLVSMLDTGLVSQIVAQCVVRSKYPTDQRPEEDRRA